MLLTQARQFAVSYAAMTRSAHLNIAIRAAMRAGDIMRRERSRLHQLHIETKAPGDFVSEIDRACEAAIVRSIQDMYPDHGILAEESGKLGNQDSDHLWIIDPLDGTTNYLHEHPHFCVSIALRVRGVLQDAVIYDPLREELFTATRGEGAQLNERRIRCSRCSSVDNALIGTGFPIRKRRQMAGYMKMYTSFMEKAQDIRRSGSSCLDMAYVACGRLDGFFELGLQPWDMAAGALIVREAGGVVVDFSGGDDYLRSGEVIAAPFKMIAPMLKKIETQQGKSAAAAD